MLKKVLGTPDGVINPEEIRGQRYLGTIKQELARLKKNQATARDRALLELDEHIHEHGPPGLSYTFLALSRITKNTKCFIFSYSYFSST